VRRLSFPFLLLAGALLTGVAAARPKSLFYLTSDQAGIQSFIEHASKIDILVPTWYRVDRDGNASGGPNPMVMDWAKQAHVPVMPIIVNPGFNQDDFHKLVTTPAARQKMIAYLVQECARQGYLGIQFDFENIIETDRDALSTLVREAADMLHRGHFQLSIATVPNAPGRAGDGAFSKWIFSNWRAAYDLKAIGEAVDLLCLMTYDEHTRYTPPGPVAGYIWTRENLDYALQYVPKEKLSLGIPVYGYRWYAGDPGAQGKANITATTVGGADVRDLMAKFHPETQWDAADRSSWFYFYRDQTREWVFYTDARTFQARYDLIASTGLQGFCSWVLGKEDPTIWDLLPAH
jgi:spore germination protein YaaH